jgi:DNA-binding PadR family transcriptional regulator
MTPPAVSARRLRALSRPSLLKHDVYLLLALLDQPQHGYGIIQSVAQYTDGEIRLGTSTVYSALRRMCTAGLILETRRPASAISQDERRRYYRPTTLGREVARAAARDIQRLHHLFQDAQMAKRRSGFRQSRP